MGTLGKVSAFIRDTDYTLYEEIRKLIDSGDNLESTFSQRKAFSRKMKLRETDII